MKKEKAKKIIQFIYNVLSALFIAFVGVSLIITSCSNKEVINDKLIPNIQNVERKSRDNYFVEEGDDGGVYLSLQDLFDEKFTLSLFDLLANSSNDYMDDFFYHTDSGWSNYSTGNTYQIDIKTSELNHGNYGLLYKYSFNYGTLNPVYSYPQNTALDYIPYFTITTSDSSTYYHGYDFKFYNNYESPRVCLNARLYLRKPQALTGYGNYSTQLASFTSDFGDYISCKDYYIYVPRGSILYSAYKEVYDVLDDYEEGYDIGYDEGKDYGYMTGYTAGKMDGYDLGNSDGYQAGYIVGLQNAQTSPANAFSLIASAFESMAGILNIQIFPNFTIGVLVFIPVILAIVFVVVKMIKG